MSELASVSKPQRSRRTLLLAIIGLAIAAGGGAAGFYYANRAQGDGHAEDPRRPKLVARSVEAAAVANGDKDQIAVRRTGTVSVESDTTPVDSRKFEIAYYPIGDSFTANLADGSGFVQVGLSAATFYDSRVADSLTRQSVAIRSAILLVLSDQHAATLSTPEGKQGLQRHLTKAVNGVLREREGFGGIDNIYFTSLVVQ